MDSYLVQRIADVLRTLGAQPFYLFCFLLAANAVALPYGNFVHDANLYGVQVLNRVDPGHFASDLYFQYGSQDKYSLFSMAAAPVVAWLGLPTGFFVLYVLSNSLFLFALLRFVRALIKDPMLSTLALLFMVITAMPFGGLRTFHVNEAFLTPRIAANALVLLGLERLIAGRLLAAWILVLMAMPLHPLMAFPGILILGVWLAHKLLGLKWCLGLFTLSAAVLALLLCDVPLGTRFFGHMDEAWRDSVHRANPYLFPLEWTADDWIRIFLSFAVVFGVVRFCCEEECVRRLLIVVSGVAAVGLVGAIAACYLPYALPLQGQSYRWLWPLELTLYPLGFLVVQRLWETRQVMARLGAIGLLAYLNGIYWDAPFFWLLMLSAGLFGVVLWRGIDSQPRVPDWSVRAAALSLVVTFPLWTAFKIGLIASYWQQFSELLDPVEMLSLLTAVIEPSCRLALVVGALVLLVHLTASRLRFLAACSVSWAAACLVFFVLPQSKPYSEYHTLYGADERFISEYLARTDVSRPAPTIYWPCRNIALIWLEMRANIYFEWPHQIAGNLFSEGTAREGARRAQLVKRFESDRLRKERILYGPRPLRQFFDVYQTTEDEPSPQVEDLLALCREKQLDLVILPQEFPGLYSASNGKHFIYDCRTIRAGLGRRRPAQEGIAFLPHEREEQNAPEKR